MEYISRSSGYAHNMHHVKLTEEEMEFSDAKLLHMADNGYQVKDWWPKVEAGKAHPGHFGGIVTRNKTNMTASIKVYID